MTAYYNEHDPKAAAWLRELIADGHIAAGDVDERSIADVQPSDISDYTQVHFFAGIGGWSYAARLAGWPDDRPLWTGSCPCQPFSGAGKRQGTSDPRHLWPEFARLIRECRPAVVFGEQVASKDGRLWLAGVRADLEELGYGVGAADLCAAGVGAPHIRQRLWWVAGRGDGDRLADAGKRGRMDTLDTPERGARDSEAQSARNGDVSRLADADGGHTSTEGIQRGGQYRQQPEDSRAAGWLADGDGRGQPQLEERDGGSIAGIEASRGDDAVGRGAAGGMGDASGTRLRRNARAVSGAQEESGSGGLSDGRVADESVAAGAAHRLEHPASDGRQQRWAEPGERSLVGRRGAVGLVFPDEPRLERRDGPQDMELQGGPRSLRPVGQAGVSDAWSHADIVHCTDGKARRFEPGSFPLAHGVPGRVGLLRGYGNAIVPAVAAEFIRAYLDVIEERR